MRGVKYETPAPALITVPAHTSACVSAPAPAPAFMCKTNLTVYQ